MAWNLIIQMVTHCTEWHPCHTWLSFRFQGRGDMNFVEVYNGLQKYYKAIKLTASTGYQFRLAAINDCGRRWVWVGWSLPVQSLVYRFSEIETNVCFDVCCSEYSEIVCHCTQGSVPFQPDPPMLSEPYVKSLVISWIKRPNDEEFILQMEDEATVSISSLSLSVLTFCVNFYSGIPLLFVCRVMAS